jgi:hypothetical protein
VTRFASEQPDDSVKDARLRSAILRKRIGVVFPLVLSALIATRCTYGISTYLRSTHWRQFWVGEVVVAAWLVDRVVRVLRNTPSRKAPGSSVSVIAL